MQRMNLVSMLKTENVTTDHNSKNRSSGVSIVVSQLIAEKKGL